MSTHTAVQKGLAGIDALGCWSTVVVGASIPVSIALDNLLLATALFAWLAGTNYRAKINLTWINPVYRWALLLFAVLLIGTAWGQAAPGDAKLYLSKYLDLALIPVLGWAFVEAGRRMAGLHAIAGSLLLVLLLSCALKAGLIPPNPWMHGTSDAPVIFKLRLTHNILMAFAAFVFAWFALTAQSLSAKIIWSILSILAVANVVLMVDGVTGYLVLASLILLLSWQRAGWSGCGLAFLACAGAVVLLFTIPGPFQTRAQGIMQDLRTERADRPASSSSGYRMEFYRNTLELIKKHPLLGTGTGSFPAAYADQIKGTGSSVSKNPHNEFMMIAVQTGVIGLGIFIWLLWQQWRLAPQLPTPLERGLAQGLVVTMVVVCMLNSALLDHTEGLLYAWLTALLYAGLPSRPAAAAQSPEPVAR